MLCVYPFSAGCMAYLTMVRPQLEYAFDIWDPHHAGDIADLEKVQRRAARWVMNDHSRYNSVTLILDQLSPVSPQII